MTEMSATALPRKPRLLIAVVCAFRVRDRQHEPGRAIEKAELQEIDAQERADTMRQAAERGNLPVGSRKLLGAERRILINAADRIFEARHWIVQDRLGEARHRTVAHDALMNDIVSEARLVAAEEPQHAIRKPAGMSHHAPAEARA